MRFLLRLGESSGTAMTVLQAVRRHPHARFWPDDVSYADLELSDVHGHRHVTDVYLAGLAASQGCRLATLDSALAALRPEQTRLIPR